MGYSVWDMCEEWNAVLTLEKQKNMCHAVWLSLTFLQPVCAIKFPLPQVTNASTAVWGLLLYCKLSHWQVCLFYSMKCWCYCNELTGWRCVLSELWQLSFVGTQELYLLTPNEWFQKWRNTNPGMNNSDSIKRDENSGTEEKMNLQVHREKWELLALYELSLLIFLKKLGLCSQFCVHIRFHHALID